MDPERVLSLKSHLKEALNLLKSLNSDFQEPQDPSIKAEIFANQHTLFSIIKKEALAVNMQVDLLETQVLKLK